MTKGEQDELFLALETAYKTKRKLDKIEQIIKEVQLQEDCYKAYIKIKEILESEG